MCALVPGRGARTILPPMSDSTVPAMAAPPRGKDNPLTRSVAGIIGFVVLAVLALGCLGSLPYTLGTAPGSDSPRYNDGDLEGYLLPPTWVGMDKEETARFMAVARSRATARLTAQARAKAGGRLPEHYAPPTPTLDQISAAKPYYLLGTDKLGRDLFIRCVAGGGVSIGIGLSAAAISVFIGSIYGAFAGYVGGRTDAFLMRIVDVLYGLPYILLVVLLAVAGDALVDEWSSRATAREHYTIKHVEQTLREQGEPSPTKSDAEKFLADHPDVKGQLDTEMDAIPRLRPRELSQGQRKLLEVVILLAAIGGVSWLTMSRVVRGQVLSLKNQPFMEAARAMGVPIHSQFLRHLLPNLLGPIIVYATLTVPQAILQESFLSFLGIGVKPPLPSWGNLAAEGLVELNTVKVRWWLLLFPCLLLGVTLLALNFLGEGLREAFDPKRARK